MENRINIIRHAAQKIAAEKRQGNNRKLASIAAWVIASSDKEFVTVNKTEKIRELNFN